MGGGTASQTCCPPSEIDYAEKTISDFCEREGLGGPDFSDLTHIDLAYSTTGDGEHEIQVYANFLRNEIVYLVDGSFVDSARFDNTRRLPRKALRTLNFRSSLTMRKQRMKHIRNATSPSPRKNARWLPEILSIWKMTTLLRWRKSASSMCICVTRIFR